MALQKPSDLWVRLHQGKCRLEYSHKDKLIISLFFHSVNRTWNDSIEESKSERLCCPTAQPISASVLWGQFDSPNRTESWCRLAKKNDSVAPRAPTRWAASMYSPSTIGLIIPIWTLASSGTYCPRRRWLRFWLWLWTCSTSVCRIRNNLVSNEVATAEVYTYITIILILY